MRELSLRLVDIHSQHQNLELHTRQFQLQVVDAVAHTSRELQVYQEGYHAFREASEKLTALREKAARSRADLDYLTFQYNQLGEARLSAGEQTLLEEEQMRLTHAEEIRGALEWAGELLNGDHLPIVARLKEATQRIEKITPFSGKPRISMSASGLPRLNSTTWLTKQASWPEKPILTRGVSPKSTNAST